MQSSVWGLVQRGARRAAPLLALGVVFVFASVTGFVIHLDTKPGRRLVAKMANELVSELLVSDLVIERIDVLSPTRLRVSRVSLVDRLGKPVLVLEGLEVRFGLLTLLRGILGDNEVRVAIPDVRAERVLVALTRDPKSGGLTLETAFDPVPSGPRTTPPKPLFVSLPHIAARTAIVTTNLSGVEQVKGTVTSLVAGLDVSPKGLVLSLNSDDVRVERLLARDVKGRLRSELRFPGATRASLDARAGAAPISATFGLHGTDLDFGLASTELTPAAMKDLLGGWPLFAPLAVKAHAVGPTSAMRADVEGRLGAAEFSGAGSLSLTPSIATELAVRVKALDLRSFDASAPETALDVDAKVSIRFDGELRVEATATLPESTVAGYPVPPTRIQATYAHAALTGTATVLDPKLATDVSFEVAPSGKIEFSTKSSSLDLAALARYGVEAKGRAALRTHAVLDRGNLAATFDASLAGASVSEVEAGAVAVHGRVDGPVARPHELNVEVSAEGERLAAVGMKFDRFRASSKGAGPRQAVTFNGSSDDGSALAASADVALAGAPTLSNARLESHRGAGALEVEAKRVSFDAGGVTVTDLALRSGDGSATGSISARGERRVVDFTITNLDIGRALAALGVSAPGVAGRLDGRVAFEEVGSDRKGHATLELRDGAFPPVTGVTGELSADFEGANIDVRAALGVAELGKGTLEGAASLRRSLFDARALEDLTGTVRFAALDLDLAQASRTFLEGTGIALGGRANGTVRLTRKEPRSLPLLSYELGTQGLRISRTEAPGEPPSELRLDVDSAGDLFGAEGSRVGLNVRDWQGPWIAASVEHSLGGEELARSRGKDFARAVLDAPLRARVTAYRRPLRMFGSAGASAVDGSVAAVLGITGSARVPELNASATLTSSVAAAPGADPTELAVVFQYSAERERYALEAQTANDADHVELRCAGRFGWLERGLGKDWSAKGEVSLVRVGMARLGRLLDVPIGGEASGNASFDLDGTKADAQVELDLSQLSVERQALGRGSGRLSIQKGRVEAMLDLGDEKSKLELQGDARLAFAATGPKLDPRTGGTVRATAHNFDLSALKPFVKSVATRVSGRLNGHAELSWGAEARSGRRPTTLRANTTVTDATASLVAGGGLIQKLRVQALADGSGPLRLIFSGAARSREPNLKGNAALFLDGPRLRRFDVEVVVDSFPLLYDGILMGRATTDKHARPLKVSIVSADEGQTIDIVIPAVEVKLPNETSQDLIALDDDASVEVARTAGDPKKVRQKDTERGRTTLKVRFGNRVRIKRGALEVPVGGAITMAPDGRLTGTIHFPSGVVPALGQIFRIRRGAVTFQNQEVKDGTLAIQATTRAADGTVVDLDVTGTVSAPVIAFRSDPPRSESEIVALLLGIQVDSTQGGEGEQLGRTAMALAMNKLVEGSVLTGLQFGAGETGEGEAVSTVSMRVAKTVWVEGRTVQGSDTSVNQEERTSGVVDWRFAPTWSLRGQLGEVSGVEIRWSLRY